METNKLPPYDITDNPTGCCPRFNPDGWDERELHFEDKLFLKVETKSIFHIPTNMSAVFAKAFADMEMAGACNYDDYLVLSRDPTAFKSEHLFSIANEVPGYQIVPMTGDFVTKVFEGPFKKVPKWEAELRSLAVTKGMVPKKTYFFYTTCPKCAKVYGNNYVVGVVEVEPEAVLA